MQQIQGRQLRHFHNAFKRIPRLGCDKSVTLPYFLSFHGHYELVKVVIFEEQIDVHAQGGLCGNALQAASLRGNKEIMRMLLEKGADVNSLQAAESRNERDLNRDSAVYRLRSTHHQTSRFIITISIFAVFVILLRKRVWKGIEQVSG